jgi:hypothetical protein
VTTDSDPALAAWRRKFERWVSAEQGLRSLPDAISREDLTEPLRQWWEETSEVLLAAVHLEVHFGIRPDPPIHELLAKLSVAARDLSNGNVPVLVSGVVTQGRPRTWDAERRDIGRAVRYVEAAKAGLIDDRRHNATVREAFGVTGVTVRDWCRNSDFYLDRVPESEMPDHITAEMIKAGKRYQVAGRSAKAISARGSKKA